MKPKNFLRAVEILTANHSNEIIVNKSTGNGSTTGSTSNPTLHIKNCTAAAVQSLMCNKFTVSMSNGLMVVEDYKIG